MASNLIAEVIILVAAVAMAAGITVWALDFSQERIDETQAVAGNIIDCAAADMDIPAVYLVGNDSRVLVTNVGLYDDLTIKTCDVAGGDDVHAEIITYLPINDFTKGIVKEIFYSPARLSCENFKRASVTTNCAKVIYDAKPKNC